MKIVFSHPTGNSFSRAAVKGLLDANILAEFHTTIASFPDSLLDKISNKKPFSVIKRRTYDAQLRAKTRTTPFYETLRIISLMGHFTKLTEHEKGIFSVDAVYKNLDSKIAARLTYLFNKKATAVYGYEDAALTSFIKAKQLGMKCLYDLPIGYWRASRELLEIEKERWPDWASTLNGLSDSQEKLTRKDQELKLADKIFVASKFTADTLKNYPGTLAPIEVIPYGFPGVNEKRSYPSFYNRPLKLLFVGGLSQRKGIADLFKVADILGSRVELTVVGLKSTDDCAALDSALRKHKWIPTLPHDQILSLMRANDVLVFPSVFEGFGLVITEAMSQGTPVITTERTAGPEIIEHKNNGWLIEASSTDSLLNAIEELLTHPGIIAKAGANAMEAARLRPWKKYADELVTAILKTS